MEITYNDGLCNGGRTPKLWIVHRGAVYLFTGSAVNGVVAILATEYEKCGKWSNTTYRLQLADGAVACTLLAPLHGQVWPENDRMEAYRRFKSEFGVMNLSFEAFDTALGRDYPKTRARMIEAEAAIESLDGDDSSAEVLEVSTSQPSRRTPHSDVRVVAGDGRSWIVAHDAPAGLCVEGVFTLLDVKRTPGYRGGSTTLQFAVVAGVSVSEEYYPKDGEPNPHALGRGGQLPCTEPTEQSTSEAAAEDSSGEEALRELLAKYPR